jgi:hypothetical protein
MPPVSVRTLCQNTFHFLQKKLGRAPLILDWSKTIPVRFSWHLIGWFPACHGPEPGLECSMRVPPWPSHVNAGVCWGKPFYFSACVPAHVCELHVPCMHVCRCTRVCVLYDVCISTSVCARLCVLDSIVCVCMMMCVRQLMFIVCVFTCVCVRLYCGCVSQCV